MNFHQAFNQYLAAEYPILGEHGLLPISANLICPAIIDIQQQTIAIIVEAIHAFYRLRELPSYKENIQEENLAIKNFDPANKSVLMGFDFQIRPDGKPFLMEVNTNAAFSLPADLLNRYQGVPNPFGPPFQTAIKDAFHTEYSLFNPGNAVKRIALVDENYRQQNLYFEFLMYKQLFESWGWECILGDPRDFNFSTEAIQLATKEGKKVDFVYNRYCDFLLQQPMSSVLREAYLKRSACFSPNPHEYLLLADKNRLYDWAQPDWLEGLGLDKTSIAALRKVLPAVMNVENYDAPEQLWKERKHWFFKPKRAYGGKGTYRGATVTRKVFQQIISQPYIAQEFVPASTVNLDVEPGTSEEFKYDARFYVYRGEVQMMIGRVYRGQTTNVQSQGGGFAALRVV